MTSAEAELHATALGASQSKEIVSMMCDPGHRAHLPQSRHATHETHWCGTLLVARFPAERGMQKPSGTSACTTARQTAAVVAIAVASSKGVTMKMQLRTKRGKPTVAKR